MLSKSDHDIFGSHFLIDDLGEGCLKKGLFDLGCEKNIELQIMSVKEEACPFLL